MYCIANSFFYDYRDRVTGNLTQSNTFSNLYDALEAFNDAPTLPGTVSHLWALSNLVGYGSITVMIQEV